MVQPLLTIRSLLEEDKVEEAIEELKSYLVNNQLFDEIIMASARNKNIKKMIRQDLIDFQSGNIERNKIRRSLLEVLQEIESQIGEKRLRSSKKSKFAFSLKDHWFVFLLVFVLLLVLFTQRNTIIGIKGKDNDHNHVEIKK